MTSPPWPGTTRLPPASALLVPANRKDKLSREAVGDVVPTRQKWRWLARPQPAQPVSPHLVDPAQAVLFDARRTWGFLSAGELDQLPALTPAARILVEEFTRHARNGGWDKAARNNGSRIRALSDRPGTTIRRVLQFLAEHGMVIPDPALRSLFRALRQERVIFRDPTRGITLSAMRRLPVPIPADQLRGLIDRTDGPMSKLIVTLIAVHALGKKETALLLAGDLDLSAGRLIVRRSTGQHSVYLDDLTHAHAIAWLRERRRHWPLTVNPHLLATAQTAADTRNPPIALTVIDAIFQKLGLMVPWPASRARTRAG
jgi:hypothetical protein